MLPCSLHPSYPGIVPHLQIHIPKRKQPNPDIGTPSVGTCEDLPAASESASYGLPDQNSDAPWNKEWTSRPHHYTFNIPATASLFLRDFSNKSSTLPTEGRLTPAGREKKLETPPHREIPYGIIIQCSNPVRRPPRRSESSPVSSPASEHLPYRWITYIHGFKS
jgi:hypothetical protein